MLLACTFLCRRRYMSIGYQFLWIFLWYSALKEWSPTISVQYYICFTFLVGLRGYMECFCLDQYIFQNWHDWNYQELHDLSVDINSAKESICYKPLMIYCNYSVSKKLPAQKILHRFHIYPGSATFPKFVLLFKFFSSSKTTLYHSQ